MLGRCCIIFLFCLCCVTCKVRNCFGDETALIAIFIGGGIQGKVEPLCIVDFSYGQLNEFFRLQGRRNFEFFGFLGKETYARYSCFSIGLSQDIVIPVYKGIFVGTGLGVFVWNKKTDRVNSKFTFGEKVFVGIRSGDECVEFVGRHFSNGDLTDENAGYNFIGVAIVYNF